MPSVKKKMFHDQAPLLRSEESTAWRFGCSFGMEVVHKILRVFSAMIIQTLHCRQLKFSEVLFKVCVQSSMLIELFQNWICTLE
mmetsp:Transcript_30913/g.78273  ORF Transcript_30913/g.78273 Transcript_30913/m.78273 type:complete len:84 (+) Transcript_30913:815-1066(+)